MFQIALRRLLAMPPVRGLPCLIAVLAWGLMAQVAAAQPPGGVVPGGKDYYLQYMLVSLCIALGLLAALRPSSRQDPEGGGVGWFSLGAGHAAEAPARPGERRKTPHRGAKLLVMSLIGLLICPIFSLVAMSMAKEDLAGMKAGRVDRNGEQLTNVSFWISVASLVLFLVGLLVTVLVAML